MSNNTKDRRRGRPRSAETQHLIDEVHGMLQRAGGHARQNEEQARHGEGARKHAELFVNSYNAHFTLPEFGVLTTLTSLLLVFEDASSRCTPKAGLLDMAEASEGYWPAGARKSRAATLCFLQAYRAGLGAQRGLYEDKHDMQPSRAGHPEPYLDTEGCVRREHRMIALDIDERGLPVEIGLREKRQLQAGSYVLSASPGAWLGFMARMPPGDWDWDWPKTLWSQHWGPEWGHPACILPERGEDPAILFRNSIYPILFADSRERGFAAIERVWTRRQRRRYLLEDPSFAVEEAIKVLGAVVGICPQSEAAARNLIRYCLHRERAGRLAPRWAIRLCLADRCSAPLFIHEVRTSRGNACLPSYCKIHAVHPEAQRRLRQRRREERKRQA